MFKLLSTIASLLILLTMAFIYCTDPENPFENTDNVTIQLTIPERPDSLLWKAHDTIPIEATVSLPDLVDYIKFDSGENDSILFIYLSTGSSNDTTLIISYVYADTGLKTIHVNAYAQNSEIGKGAVGCVYIGLKPLIDNDKKIQRPDTAILGSLFYMYLTATGSDTMVFHMV